MYLHTSYRQADMKSCGHPAENGWIQVLRPVRGSHHHNLNFENHSFNTLFHRNYLLHCNVFWQLHYSIRKHSGCVTWVVDEVSRPSHRLMNWAFIMAVASWSMLERFLRNDSNMQHIENIYTRLILLTWPALQQWLWHSMWGQWVPRTRLTYLYWTHII